MCGILWGEWSLEWTVNLYVQCRYVFIHYYQQVYGVRKQMNEFLTKTWKKITLNFKNWLKETGNCTAKWPPDWTVPSNCWANFHRWEGAYDFLSLWMIMYIPAYAVEPSNITHECVFWLMADVQMAEYFIADMYVRVAVVMASAGTSLWT